jgi:hypothetical protein
VVSTNATLPQTTTAGAEEGVERESKRQIVIALRADPVRPPLTAGSGTNSCH